MGKKCQHLRNVNYFGVCALSNSRWDVPAWDFLVSDDKFHPSEEIPPPPLCQTAFRERTFQQTATFYPKLTEKGKKSPNCVAVEHLGCLKDAVTVFTNCRQLNFFLKNKFIPKEHAGPFVPAGISSPANGVSLLLKHIEAPGRQLPHFPAYLTS